MTVHFYFYHLEQNGKEYIGFGVTKNPTKRHKDHISNFSKGGVTCRDYRYMACKSKIEAIDLENKAKAIVPFSGLDVPGFKTESILFERLHIWTSEIYTPPQMQHLCFSQLAWRALWQ